MEIWIRLRLHLRLWRWHQRVPVDMTPAPWCTRRWRVVGV